MTSFEAQYRDKPAGYFDAARMAFVERLPHDPQAHLLEVGCGAGATGAAALAAGRCGRCTGVELAPRQAEAAQARLTTVIQGDVEDPAVALPADTFDALIASEVLEHLRDPWAALAKMAAALKPGAVALAGSPNAASRDVIDQLRRGRFDYAEAGVMDRTHLRWFTPATYAEMFQDAGFEVLAVWPPKPVRPLRRLRALLYANGQQRYWPQICLHARKR